MEIKSKEKEEKEEAEEEEDEEEEQADGECDNYTVDLSRVDTASLLKEIERRVIATTCDNGREECEARE